MTSKLLVSLIAVVSACPCLCPLPPPGADAYNQAPFACNLKAFSATERAEHRKLSERLVPAVSSARELPDGYALRIDAAALSLPSLARWADLEQKCCPFFDFQLDLHGVDGALWLSLKGRGGVKQFIEIEFVRLRDKLPQRSGTR